MAGRLARGISGRDVWTHVWPAHAQIVKYRPRNNGHGPVGCFETDPSLLQPLLHAAGRGQPERAAPAEQYRVYPVDPADRVQQVGLARARRSSPDRCTAHRAVRGQDHRAPGGRFRVRPMPRGHAGHVNDGTEVFPPVGHCSASVPTDANNSSARSSRWSRLSALNPRLSRYNRSAASGCRSDGSTDTRLRSASVTSREMLAT